MAKAESQHGNTELAMEAGEGTWPFYGHERRNEKNKQRWQYWLQAGRRVLKSEESLGQLCRVCRSIDFARLLFHLSSQPPVGLKDGGRYVLAELGFLDELIRRSSSCEFCALILDA